MFLDGKIALVTGSSRGIGRAIAVSLAEQGANIVVNYAGNIESANETADLVKKLSRQALVVKADVSNEAEVKEMVDQTIKEFGRIDILINNAGITRDNLIMRMKDEDWDGVINTNLKGAFHCCRAVARPMIKAKQGKIVNISSVVGLSGNSGQVNYSAAKAGLIGLTKSLAAELGSRHVTVNAVAPGFVTTDMTEKLSLEVKERLIERIPLGRLCSPKEIANVVAFLCSPVADYITGQIIAIDGGMTSRL